MGLTSISNVWYGQAADLRVALITGASRGLGASVAEQLAATGWRVALQAHRHRAEADALAARIRSRQGGALVVEADLSRAKSEALRLVAEVRRALGPIGLLVHAACPPVRDESPIAGLDALDEMFAVNAVAFLELARHLLPDMLSAQYGTLVGVLTSTLRAPVYGRWRSYAVAKAALAGAIGAIAAETEGTGVRALAIAPGAFLSSGNDQTNSPRRAVGLTTEAVAQAVLELVDKLKEHPNGSCWVLTGKEPEWATRLVLDPRSALIARRDTAVETPLPEMPVGLPASAPANHLDERVRKVLAFVLGADPEADLSQAALGSFPGWDSLNHMVIMMELESRFGVQFTASDIAQLTSLAKIETAVGRLLSKAKH